MRYAHIWQAVFATPWAITPAKLAAILDILALHESGGRLSAEEIRAVVGAAQSSYSPPRKGNGIAVLPLFGTIIQRVMGIGDSSGTTSTEKFGARFEEALSDPSVGSIVLNIDSPGGNVSGVPELAEQIYQGAQQKRVVAVANSFAASAAYWIASQCESLWVTPSGMVGSIGVIAAHEDVSGMLDKLGVKLSLITAGEHKGEMNPYNPLSDADRAAMQQLCDYYYGQFTAGVARGRGVAQADVQAGMGRGRVVHASDAVALGMADGIDTLDGVIQRIAEGRYRKPRDRGASAEAGGWEPLEIVTVGGGTAIGAARDALPPFDGSAERIAPPLSASLSAGPIAPHKTATTDEPWDGPANEARLKNDDPPAWRRAYAWYDSDARDPDGDGYPDRKSDYRYIHHMVSEAGEVGAANTTACSTGIGVLNGGRGGTTIPDGDREGVHAHLAKHLRDAGKEPPPLKGSALPSSPDAAAAEPRDQVVSPRGLDLRRRRLRLHEAARR